MSAFIHGMGLISAQQTFGEPALGSPVNYAGGRLPAIEPGYAPWIDAKTIRRMSKIIRTGTAAAKLALQQSGVEKPDAIITGTGLGCLDDTEVFLRKLVANREEALNPTPFIQSTHNTIGSQVALILQCLGYNQTYTHRAFSFELALEDALMLLQEQPGYNVLAGSADELTALGHMVYKSFGWTSDVDSLKLFTQPHAGTVHGEGASYFLLNTKQLHAVAKLDDIKMFFKPAAAELHAGIPAFMAANGLAATDVDVVLTGRCGDPVHDQVMNAALEHAGLGGRSIDFKHLCGEYSTASSFAVWLAATILKNQQLPRVYQAINKPIRNVLIYNQYFSQHHTLILLTAC